MYSWILIFVEGKVIDLVVDGANVHKTLMIITSETEQVRRIIIEEIGRGAKPPRRCGLLGEISLLSPG